LCGQDVAPAQALVKYLNSSDAQPLLNELAKLQTLLGEALTKIVALAEAAYKVMTEINEGIKTLQKELRPLKEVLERIDKNAEVAARKATEAAEGEMVRGEGTRGGARQRSEQQQGDGVDDNKNSYPDIRYCSAWEKSGLFEHQAGRNGKAQDNANDKSQRVLSSHVVCDHPQ
jgi:ABC-type transporter Mla subunit MlaD